MPSTKLSQAKMLHIMNTQPQLHDRIVYQPAQPVQAPVPERNNPPIDPADQDFYDNFLNFFDLTCDLDEEHEEALDNQADGSKSNKPNAEETLGENESKENSEPLVAATGNNAIELDLTGRVLGEPVLPSYQQATGTSNNDSIHPPVEPYPGSQSAVYNVPFVNTHYFQSLPNPVAPINPATVGYPILQLDDQDEDFVNISSNDDQMDVDGFCLINSTDYTNSTH